MKKLMIFMLAVMVCSAAFAFANTAPSVVAQSAVMRPGTTLMDVVYRVNDPDDATVKVRALAFVDGVRSFANVLRPVTFAEGTEVNLGDTIATNVDHTLTWNVASDWNVDLGQVKFEVLAMDGRGLLEFDWITIPAAAGKPELTISKDAPSDTRLLDALFWQYASGDTKMTLGNGILKWVEAGNLLDGSILAEGTTLSNEAAPYVLREMNLDPASHDEVQFAHTTARAELLNITKWHVANRPYAVSSYVMGWGSNIYKEATPVAGLTNAIAVVAAAGERYSLALTSGGTVVYWGTRGSNPPAGLTDVTAIAAGNKHSLALKSDGTVVGWGEDLRGQATPPVGLTNVTAIAAGNVHSLALKSDGTVVGWGTNFSGELSVAATPPEGLTNVTAIAAYNNLSLAVKLDGTVVYWGSGGSNPPAGLTDVTDIAVGQSLGLALKSDGTVVAWGGNPPAGLSNITAISGSRFVGLALKSDGTVVGWWAGSNTYGQANPPAGLSNVISIAAGEYHSLAIVKEPNP